MNAIAIVSLLLVFAWLAYVGASARWWLGITLGAFVLLTVAGHIGPVAAVLLAIAYLAGAALYVLPSLRRQLLTRHLLSAFRKAMPAMSDTEREALDAGTVGWEGDLFSGRPDWRKLLAQPAGELNAEEQAFMDGPVETLCRMLDDWRITHEDQDLPEEVWQYLKQQRFFGMIIPKAYGGLEFSALAHSDVVMKIASRSITAAVTVMVPNSLGPGKLLLHYGTDEQKKHYLPRLACGEEIPCFALTGPQAGSDAGAIPDTGIVCVGRHQGRDTLGIRLNWEKRYITLGPVATVLGLAFKLYDPDHLIGKSDELGITVALIPTNHPGISIGQRHIPLNIPFQNGPNRGRDVFIPLDWIIGGRERIGQGWRMLVESLAEGRGISLPALATGGGKAACRYTGAYARVRKQFEQPIGYFEGVEEALARLAGRTYQMDAARRLMLSALDRGERPSVQSAIVKYHLTERYRHIINDAMDIHGGSGICLGPSNLVGRAYQAVPISITVEGANILTRSMIIFGQGAIRAHPYVLREFEAAHLQDDKAALVAFDTVLFAHVGYMLRNLSGTLWMGLSGARFSRVPSNLGPRRAVQHLNRMASAFALCADVAMMTLGGSLKRKERISARLGDILSQLFIASALLKQRHAAPADNAEQELFDWAMTDLLHDMQEAFRGLFANLPSRALATLLRRIVFPLGLPFTVPTDHQDHQAARVLLEPSTARDRLTRGIFLSKDTGEAVGRLELAFEAAVAAEPTEHILRRAVKEHRIAKADIEVQLEQALQTGVINASQAQTLRRATNLRNQVIAVDAFDRWGQNPETPHQRPADAA